VVILEPLAEEGGRRRSTLGTCAEEWRESDEEETKSRRHGLRITLAAALEKAVG
jgi:hypothetical protein